jgi:hypothetical protein
MAFHCRYSDKTRISHFHENRVIDIFIFCYGKTTHRPEKKCGKFEENLSFPRKSFFRYEKSSTFISIKTRMYFLSEKDVIPMSKSYKNL